MTKRRTTYVPLDEHANIQANHDGAVITGAGAFNIDLHVKDARVAEAVARALLTAARKLEDA